MDSFYVCQLHVLRWIRMGDRVEFSDKTRRRRRLMIKIDFDEIEINTVNHMWRHIIHSLAAIATNADKYFYQKAIVFFFVFLKNESRVYTVQILLVHLIECIEKKNVQMCCVLLRSVYHYLTALVYIFFIRLQNWIINLLINRNSQTDQWPARNYVVLTNYIFN